MSRTIDDRVVEMRFDNKQFENNVQTSINTLGKLKQSLDLSGAAKGLENVDKAASGVNMTGLASAVETVQSKFSALQVIGITALANITNSAVNAGIQLVKSLSIDQITAGWQKFSDKTTSVATLVAQGNAIEDVNAQLDKLNWFTDETSYNFTDMVSNIAKFTATGKGLEESVTAMEGIATWAALSGQNAATASRAMYQISQAMGAGVMRLEDYKSIQNASMDTEEFRQKCLDAGVALGKLKKNADGTYQSLVATGDKGSEAFGISQFATKLTEGAWLTSDVMMQVFNDYSSAVSGIYEAAEEKGMLASEVIDEIHKKAEKEGISTDEAIKSLGYNFDSFALKAFEAAQKARTFGDAIDSVKDAVSTGWMNTFSLIFGDAEEATELWTDLANAMWDAFASGGEARNEMLSEWKELGGRDDLIESFWNVWDAVGGIIGPIKEAFRDIFPPMTAERLVAFTKALKEFTAKLKLSDTASENLKRTFKGLFAVFDIAKQAISAVFKGLSPVFRKLVDLGGAILGVTAKIGDWIVKLDDTVKKTKVFDKGVQVITNTLKNFGQKAIDVFNKVKPAIMSAVESIKQFLQIGKEKFVTPGLELIHAFLGRVQARMSSLSDVADAMRDGIITAFEAIGDALSRGSFFKFIETLWKVIVTVGGAIGKILGQLTGGLIEKIGNADFSGILDLFNSLTLGGIVVLMMKFVNGIKKVADSVGTFKDSAIGILDSVRGCFEAYQTKLKADVIMKIATAIAILVASILVLSLIDSKKLDESLTALAMLFVELLASLALFTKIAGKFTSVAKACGAMISMSVAVLILAGALKTIASLDMDQILKGLLGLAGIMTIAVGALFALSKFVEKSSKTFSLSKNGIFSSKTKKNFVELGIAMIAIAASMKIFASAAKDLAELDWNGLAKGMVGIGVVLGEVIGFIALVKVIKPEKMISTSISLIAIAASMKVFASAAKDFADMNWEDLGKAGAAIAGILLVVAGFSKLIGKSEKIFSISKNGLFSKQSSQSLLSMSVALIAMGAAMKVFASAAKLFAEMSWEDLGKAGAAIAGILLSIGGFMRLMPSSANMISTGAGLVIMAASMKVFASAAKLFAEMSWEDLGKAGAAIAGILIVIAAFGKIMDCSFILETSIALGVMSVSMVIFASAMNLLSVISWEGIAKGIVAIGGALAILGIAGYAFAPVVPAILGLAVALTLIGVGALALGLGLTAIGVGLATLSASLAALAGSLTVVVAGIVAIVKGVIVGVIEAIGEGIIKLCEMLAGSTVALCAALKAIVLALIDVLIECIPPLVDGALKLVAGILEALVAYTPQIVDSLFEFLIAIIEGLGRNTPKLIQAVVDMLMVLFQGAIDAITSIDPEVFIKGAGAIAALAGMMAALSAVAVLIPSAMVGVLGIAAVLAEFGALAQIPGLSWLIDEGGELLSKIGKAIGGFVGGLVGGFASGITDSLPAIATNLSMFMTNLQPFLIGARSIDPSMMDGVNALIGTILALTGTNLLESITSWLTGGSSLAQFGEEIASFGPMLKAYSDSVVGIDPEAIRVSAEAAKALAEMASVVPNEGGVAAWFAGENSIASFGSQLPILGAGLKGFSDSVTGIVPENIIAAANAAKVLAEMTSTIPNEGGIAAWFAGENSIASFGSQLPILGAGLKGFSDSVTGIVPENIIAAVNAAKALAAMTSTIPNEGGIASWFTGENSVSKFANDIVVLGGGLKGFSDVTAGIVPENIIAASNAAKALAEMTSTIPNEGGIASWFTGENSVSNFAYQLPTLGTGLKAFSDVTAGIVPENIIAASNAAKALAEMANTIPNEGGVVAWFAGENSIASFGSQLPILGLGLKGFSDAVTGIVPESVTAATNAAKTLADMTSVIPTEGGIKAWFVGENSIASFGSQLPILGAGLKGFSDSVSGINSESVTSASNAAKTLAEMTSVVPTEGGIKVWFAGENSIASFGSQLPILGAGLKGFSDSVSGINPENVIAAANGAKALAEMTSIIPNEGGIKAWFSGNSGVATFSDKLPTLGKALKGFSDSVAGINPENVTAAASAAKSLGDMTATIPKNTDKIDEFGSNLEKFGSKLTLYFEKTKAITSESISGANSAIKSIKEVSTINSGSIKSAAKAIDDLIESIKGMAKVTAASATNFKNALTELGKVSSEAFLKPFKNIKSDMEKAGKNAIGAFIDGVKSKKSSVESAAKEIANKSKEGIEGKRESFKTTGRYLVEGFAEGIDENTYMAEARARAMAAAAAEAAKEELDENSPSKVGYKIGDFFGVAFVNAIGEYKDKAYKTSADVAGSAKSGLRNSLNNIRDIIDGNIDTQPSIRPVLDLSDVRAGAAEIGGMLNMNSQVGVLANARSINTMMNNQNGSRNDIVSAINDLSGKLNKNSGDTYNINGITYDDGSNIAYAVKSLVRAARVERRT